MGKTRVFDCFTFFNERDLLRLRIDWLKDVVDVFVIAEATRTFTGRERVPEFRFEDYDICSDRVRYVLVDNLAGPGCDPWSNEKAQRNALLRGLVDVQDADIVHVSDVDEIPARSVFQRYRSWWVCASLEQRLYYYQWNNRVRDAKSGDSVMWSAAKITSGGNLRRVWGTPENLRRKVLPNRTISNRLRFRFTHKTISDGGWHWSYMMTPEQIAGKIESFSHTEFSGGEFSSVESVRRRVDAGVDPFERGFRLERVAVAEEFPRELAELMQERFPKYVRD